MEQKITELTGKDFDSVISGADLKKIYAGRREKLVEIMREKNLGAVVFEDSEDKRDCAIRYLTGHPSDAALVITSDGFSTLVPWDENLAAIKAHADRVIPSTKFDRDNIRAVADVLKNFSCENPTVAIPPETTFIRHQKFVDALKGWTVECREDSIHSATKNLRARKDEYEIACTRKACSITSGMTDEIIRMLSDGKIHTETDVALFAERRLRELGCERTSFDTLAAGPERSYAIHAFPGYTNGSWGQNGISLLDYGVCFEGYASDCTITVARGKLSAEQTEILDLVQKAADECLKLYKPGKPIRDAVKAADDIFAEKGKSMPHGLGHGTGLEIHENPFVSTRSPETKLFESGNIVTLEPGLYDPKLGGCRLENDVLITDDGNCVLTNSRIFRM